MIIKDKRGHQVDFAELDPAATMLTLAIGIVSERIRGLPREDQDDLFELFKVMSDASSDDEEQTRARNAMMEILDDGTGSVKRLELSPDAKSAWSGHVGSAIKGFREERGWNQDDLASKAGLSSQSYVSRIEAGLHSPSSLTVERIAAALGVSPAKIDPCYGDDGEDGE